LKLEGSPAHTTPFQPQPSLGSLPQLAVDLYIHTLKLSLVGFLAIRDTIPAVSGLDSVEGEEAKEGISFGVEGEPDLKLVKGASEHSVEQSSKMRPRRSRSSFPEPQSSGPGNLITSQR
jgi:hypothetical protein